MPAPAQSTSTTSKHSCQRSKLQPSPSPERSWQQLPSLRTVASGVVLPPGNWKSQNQLHWMCETDAMVSWCCAGTVWLLQKSIFFGTSRIENGIIYSCICCLDRWLQWHKNVVACCFLAAGKTDSCTCVFILSKSNSFDTYYEFKNYNSHNYTPNRIKWVITKSYSILKTVFLMFCLSTISLHALNTVRTFPVSVAQVTW